MKKTFFLIAVLLSIVFLKNTSYSQNHQVRTYNGSYKEGTAKYSYYEDSNGNIILQGSFEYRFIKSDYDREGKYKFDKDVVFKGNFKDGKKEGEWTYIFPIFNSNEDNARGGGNAEINITLDRDRITERSYDARDYIPGDHFIVETGQLVIKVNYSNGKRHGKYQSLMTKEANEYEKLAGKNPKFIKKKYIDKSLSLLSFKNGLPVGKASITLNNKPLLTGEFYSEGNFDGTWSFNSPIFQQNENENIVENLTFKKGFIVSAQKINLKTNETLLNLTDDAISNLLDTYEKSPNTDLGFSLGNKIKIDDVITQQQLPALSQIPIGKFPRITDQILELISGVYLVAGLEIDNYDNKYEAVDCFNFNNFIVNDETKIKNFLGDPFNNIYKKHLTALGGEDAIRKILSYKVTQEIVKSQDINSYGSKDEVFEKKAIVKFKTPDKCYYEFPECFNFKSNYFWSNANKSYNEYDYNEIKSCSLKDRDYYIFKTMIFPIFQMKEYGCKFEVLNKKLNNIVIRATSRNGSVVDLYLDNATYLLVKYDFYISDSETTGRFFNDFINIKDNYKEYQGVLLPWREKLGKYVFNIEYQLNLPISNKEFEPDYQIKPAQRQVEGW